MAGQEVGSRGHLMIGITDWKLIDTHFFFLIFCVGLRTSLHHRDHCSWVSCVLKLRPPVGPRPHRCRQ